MADVHRVGPCYVFVGNPNIPRGEGMAFLGFTRGDVTVAPNINISTGRVDQIGMSGLAGSAWSGGLDPSITTPLIDEDKDKLLEYILGSRYRSSGSAVGAAVKVHSGGASLVFTSVTPRDEVRNGSYQVICTTAGNAATSRWQLRDPYGKVIESDIEVGVGATDGAVANNHIRFKIAQTGTAVLANSYTLPVTGAQASIGFGSGFTALDVIGTLAMIPYDELDQGTNGVDAPNGIWVPAAVCYDLGNWVYNLPEGTDDAHVVHECMFRGLRLDFDTRAVTRSGSALTGTNRRAVPPEHRVMFIGPPSSIPDTALTIGGVDYTTNKIAAWNLPATSEV